MSYGIICRIGDCQSYAQYAVVEPGKLRQSYAYNVCSVGFRRLRELTTADHTGPEGMKSIAAQKENPFPARESVQELPAEINSRAERRRIEKAQQKLNRKI